MIYYRLSLASLLVTAGWPEAEAGSGNKPSVIVEPYLAAWCAKQFPNELRDFDGYSMAQMTTSSDNSRVKIEPFIGRWCFDQFPELDVLDKNEAIDNLYEDHEQLEPFLEDWGKNSLQLVSDNAEDHVLDIEPYIGAWCAEQYPEPLGSLKDTIYVDVQDQHVKFEPALARWCFAQFPNELMALDEEIIVEELKTDHELVESELMEWVMTTPSVVGASTSNKGDGKSGGSKVAIILLSCLSVVSLGSLLYVTRRRWCNSKEMDSMQP